MEKPQPEHNTPIAHGPVLIVDCWCGYSFAVHDYELLKMTVPGFRCRGNGENCPQVFQVKDLLKAIDMGKASVQYKTPPAIIDKLL